MSKYSSKNKEKAAFFEQYAFAADKEVLEMIWQAKQNKETDLNLGSKNISDLSPLTKLTILQSLYIDNTQVSDLSPLTHLTALKTLSVFTTQVRDLSPLTHLTGLHTLAVSNTQVNDLRPLTNLTALEILLVSNIQVSDLSFLKTLTALQTLDISSTQVSNLKLLTHLTALHTLYVSDTQVSDLSHLTSSAALQRLDVSNTQVSDLSPLAHLIEKGIEVKWTRWDGKDGIFIKDTPLSNPPIEIAKQGNAAILAYWAEQKAGTIRLNEARLLIVGQGGSGKTTLRKKLMDVTAAMPADKDTTRGIEIEVLSFPNRRLGNADREAGPFGLHIWDFGGQNIQHYAHQFFLSDAVVYALVHSEREQNEHSSYWLSIIELLGKESPVLIVQNEKHGHSEDLKNLAAIRERFPNVKNPIKVDLSKAAHTNYTAFKDLQAEIQHLACHLPHIGKEYPVSLTAVRTDLQTLAATKNNISWQDFEDLCTKQGIAADNELIKVYARYFHQLGISLWFEDDLDLSEYVFLRPKWIIDALFELLYDGDSLRKQALISVNDVKTIWRKPEYKGMHGNLLRLMKNFEMCYEISTAPPQYMVPQLLPADRDPHSVEATATKVVFDYKFLPKGFLTRLTCRLHTCIKGENVWNDAVQFEDKLGATVFAKEVYAQNAIELIAEGTNKRQLLNEVINALTDINNETKFGNLEVEILVPCPCQSCKKSNKPYYFKYDYLVKLMHIGENNERCQESLIRVQIKDILRDVNSFKLKDIRDYIRYGKAEQALHLLRNRYDERNDVISLCAQLSRLTKDDIEGLHSSHSERAERNRLEGRILSLLNILEQEAS